MVSLLSNIDTFLREEGAEVYVLEDLIIYGIRYELLI